MNNWNYICTVQTITDFRISEGIPDTDDLIRVWLPEIERAAQEHVPNDRLQAFFIAALRLAARSKSLDSLTLAKIINGSGYSRSTFFRLFEGYTSFLLRGYQLLCQLSIKVYAKTLAEREMSLDSFVAHTADILYSGNCSTPNDVVQTIWASSGKDHRQFHPHLAELALVVRMYLSRNPETAHIQLDPDDLLEVLRLLDWDLLQARIDGSGRFPSTAHYWRLRTLLSGYLKERDAASRAAAAQVGETDAI